MENRINLVIEDLKRESVATAMEGLKTELTPLLIALPAEKKRALPKAGERHYAFVENAYLSANQNKSLVPPYLNLDEVKVDMDARQYLIGLQKELEYLQSLLNDTLALCGSEAFSSMLAYYNYLKQAAKDGVPGAKAVYDDLKHHFAIVSKSDEVDPSEEG